MSLVFVTVEAYFILDPEGGSQNFQKTTLVVDLLLVVMNSLKTPKAFSIGSGAQRNFAYTFVLTFPRCTVLDFPLIF